jgi:hypothetical protein
LLPLLINGLFCDIALVTANGNNNNDDVLLCDDDLDDLDDLDDDDDDDDDIFFPSNILLLL